MLAFLDKIPYGTPLLRRLTFWLLTIFLTYVVIGFFVLPPMVKSILIDQASAGLNRQTTIKEVSFNPLTLHIEVLGFKVNKLEGDGNFLSVDAFTASPSLSSIWKLAPVISHLHLRNLALDIAFLGDGKYSISDLIAPRNTEPSAGDDGESDQIFPFALYGFEMTNATIVFDDRPHGKTHLISNLDLIVPFTSSFLDLRQEYTQPKFSAVVNGDPVELMGRTLPFDKSLRTEFELGAVDVSLDQYWTYMPIETPLQLKNGRFTSELSLFFERPDDRRMDLFLGGGGTLHDLELAAPDDGTVLSLKTLRFDMEKYSLGDNELTFSSVVLDQPGFTVIRHKSNAINWGGYFPARASAPAGNKGSPSNAQASPMNIDIKLFRIRNGSMHWQDRAIPGGFKRTFRQITMTGENISTRKETETKFDLAISGKGKIKIAGAATLEPLFVNARTTLSDFHIPEFTPYFVKALPMAVDSGMAGADADIRFTMRDGKPDLAVDDGMLTISSLVLRKRYEKEPSISLDKLSVTGAALALQARTVEVGEVAIVSPDVRVEKEKSGEIDLVRVFARDEEAARKVEKKLEPKSGDEQWSATVKMIRITDGRASYKDFSLKHPASLDIDSLQVEASNLINRKGETLTYDVSTRWGRRGVISIKGKAALDPLNTSGRLRIENVGLRPLDGHLGEHTELLFASGAASANLAYDFKGGKKPQYTISGDAALTKVQLKDNRGDGEFAGIDAFKLAGIRFANAPYRLSIADIHLQGPRTAIDFDEKGRLNIRRAFRIPEPPPVVERKGPEKEEPGETETGVTATPKKEKTFFDAIDIGKITMDDGQVTFRDASVEPVYYTKISDMKLGLIEVSQTGSARPKIDFSAKIGPTPMSITGAFNPVVTPMYSDLSIAVNGMELVPLSPYTIKHLAYPIEKGRLYADVTFKTENWELDADNKFFIEQLQLGPKDKRPDAPSVPVKFGLALLQDGNGDMELNLPIRGRLDDPDFRVGGIVFKAIASLFVKALASPFTLIGSIFGGGGEDMDFVVFQPGRHQLDQAGMDKLATTARALKERERLKLEVDGVVDPTADKAGLVEVIFEDKLKQQKFDSLSRKERAQTTVDAMVVTPEEYGDFLFEAYKDEPDPEGVKPTTLFMTDRQPVEFMEKFIIDRINVTEDDLTDLGRRRAAAVKEHIIAGEPTLTERVYLLDRNRDRKGKTGVPRHRADLGIK